MGDSLLEQNFALRGIRDEAQPRNGIPSKVHRGFDVVTRMLCQGQECLEKPALDADSLKCTPADAFSLFPPVYKMMI